LPRRRPVGPEVGSDHPNECFDAETNNRLMRASTFEWPHAFARLDAPADEVLSRFGANHIHTVPGDYVDELRLPCRILGVEFDEFKRTGA
jgi:L-fucose isomerase